MYLSRLKCCFALLICVVEKLYQFEHENKDKNESLKFSASSSGGEGMFEVS